MYLPKYINQAASTLVVISLCATMAACGGEDPDTKLKNDAQAELEAWAEKRQKFAKENCKDPEVDCQKRMREAGLDEEGKDLY